MMNLYLVLFHLISVGAVILAFKMGYQAGKKEDVLLKQPDIELPDISDESEKAPSHEEIMKDMERSRTIMQGYDFLQGYDSQ